MFRKRKKLFALPLLACLMLTSCSQESTNETETDSEEVIAFKEWAANFTYTQDAGPDGIKASLDKNDLGSTDDTIIITSYRGTDQAEIVIPETVRGSIKIVGFERTGFQNHTEITKITLPDTIETISGSSFKGLTNLTEMNLPKDTIVDSGSFDNTPYLLENYITETEDGLHIVNNNAIYNVDKEIVGQKQNIVIPDTIVSIPDDCFSDITNLKSVSFPAHLESIGDNAFDNTGLTTVQLPETVYEIGASAFANIPTLESFSTFDVTNIENDTSEYSDITFGTSTNKSILKNSFANLKSIAYSGTVTLNDLLGKPTSAQKDEMVLTNVYLNGDTIISSCLEGFSKITTLKLANSIIMVEDEAFEDLGNVTEFYPNGVNNNSRLSYIGSHTTDSTSGKSSLFTSPWYTSYVSALSDEYVVIGSSLYSKVGNPDINDLANYSIKGYCDEVLKGISAVDQTTADDVLKLSSAYVIGNNAFENTSVETLNLETNGYYVGQNAFKGVTTLKNVLLNDNTTIENLAFADCYNIEVLKAPLENTTIAKIIGTYKAETPYMLKDLTLTESVTTIASNAFKQCTNLEKVTFSDNLITINGYAFMFANLKELVIPYSVKKIGQSAFANNYNLTSVHFVDVKVESTEKDVTVDYNDEDAVATPTGLPNRLEILSSVFFMCKSLSGTFVIPFRILSLGSNCFVGTSIETLQIRLTDYDRSYRSCKNFEPTTDTNNALTFDLGFAQISYGISEGDKKPIDAKLEVVGEDTQFATK